MIRDPPKALRVVSVNSKKKSYMVLKTYGNIYLLFLCPESGFRKWKYSMCWGSGEMGKFFKSETFPWIPSSDSCKYYSGDVVFMWILGRLAKVMTENTGLWIQWGCKAKIMCQIWPYSEHHPRESWHNLPTYNILDEKKPKEPQGFETMAVTCLYSNELLLPWEGDLCATAELKENDVEVTFFRTLKQTSLGTEFIWMHDSHFLLVWLGNCPCLFT